MSGKTTFLAAGDSFITRRIPEDGCGGFTELQKLILAQDVRFGNLEITVHRQEGSPAAFSGGTWAMADPEVLDDLSRLGFNLFNTANNHSCDYSHGGVLATIRNLRERGLAFAGTGATLAEASAPCYLETKNSRVALVAASSTFHDSGAAGNQSAEVRGRPGLNPLRFETVYTVGRRDFETLKRIADRTDMNANTLLEIANGYKMPLPEDSLEFGGLRFRLGGKTAKSTQPKQRDLDRILGAVREAKRQADTVLVSIHAHEFAGRDVTRPAEFLETFCRACIDAGADAVLGHGPHQLRGIEIYRGKPIFYSLGNFIFETETVAVQPADAFENRGMPAGTTVGEYMSERSKNGTCGYGVQPDIWRSVLAGFEAENGTISRIRLYPVTLRMDSPRAQRGFPSLSRDEDTLRALAKLSEPYGTKLRIRNGTAEVVLRAQEREA